MKLRVGNHDRSSQPKGHEPFRSQATLSQGRISDILLIRYLHCDNNRNKITVMK